MDNHDYVVIGAGLPRTGKKKVLYVTISIVSF